MGGPGAGDGDAPGSEGETGPAGDADPFAELDDDLFAGIGDALEETLGDAFTFDPDVMRASVADVYENAAAPPSPTALPPTPLTSINLDDLAEAIVSGTQEAMQS
jgi:hypothetical protein